MKKQYAFLAQSYTFFYTEHAPFLFRDVKRCNIYFFKDNTT